jgi:hypothetical protein
MGARDPRPDPGLCATCRHHRQISSRRGSVFWLCRKAEEDPRFPKYPTLPVLQCPGFEPAGASSEADA